MPIHWSALPVSDSFYTFVETDGTVTHLAASLLLRTLERPHRPYPVTRCEFGETLIAALERGDLGVEPNHARRLPEAALERPGIIGLWGDTHISIDGAHRIWRRWQRGDRWFPAYVVPEAAWRVFTIEGIPGDAETWRELNKLETRTPEMEALIRLLGGE